MLQLAEAHGAQQIATTGGQMEDVPFHVLAGKPEVPITISSSPETGGGRLRASTPGIRSTWTIFDGEAFAPTISRNVPAGQYALAVTIQPPTPPFADVPLFLVPALPPSYTGVVKVLA